MTRMELITTKRLELTPLVQADAAFALKLVNTPGWLRFIGDRHVYNMADAVRFIRDGAEAHYTAKGIGMMVCRRKTDGRPIGCCGLIDRDELDDIDIGFAFLPEYEGQGYATEAANAVVAWGRQHLQLKRLGAIVTHDNERCIALLQRLGMTYEKDVPLADGGGPIAFYATNFAD